MNSVTGRSRWTALVVLCVGVLMIVLDATVVNVALPAIQADLGFSQSSLAWVVNAYLIAFGGLLLLAGRLGDLVSRRGVFLTGLAVFTAASLACGAAQSQAALIAARFVQGVGGAMTSAVVLGMIVTMFTEPREQAKAIGVYAFVASAGGSVGLLAGGMLTQAINWHWIFFINVPIGIATAFYAWRVLPAQKGTGFGRGADILGAGLITGSLMLGVYTIVKPAAEQGWTAPRTLALGATSLALLVGFVVREATAASPLVPLRIFRSRNVAGANVVQALTVAGMFGMFFLGVLYLQQVLGYDALTAGVAFLPMTLSIFAASSFAPRVVGRFGARAVIATGMSTAAVGMLLLTTLDPDSGYLGVVLAGAVLTSVGMGFSLVPSTIVAMQGVVGSQSGLASGLLNTSRLMGGALGLAVLSTIADARTSGELGVSAARALTDGFDLAFGVGALLCLAGAIVAALLLRTQPSLTVVAAPAEADEPEVLAA